MSEQAIKALSKIEKRLEQLDGLFSYNEARDEIKVVLDCLLKIKELEEYKFMYEDLCK